MTNHCVRIFHQSFKVTREPHHFHYHPCFLLVLSAVTITITITITPYPSPNSLRIYAQRSFDIILQLELCPSVLDDKPLNTEGLEEGKEGR